MKFRLAPSGYNDAVVELLGIALPPPMLLSSTYLVCCLSSVVIERRILHLSVLAFLIKYPNTVPFNSEQMAVLYHGTLFNQSR